MLQFLMVCIECCIPMFAYSFSGRVLCPRWPRAKSPRFLRGSVRVNQIQEKVFLAWHLSPTLP
jgi:hypothetical protein